LSAHDSKDVVVEVGRTEVAKAPRYVAVHMREMISDLPTKQRQALHLRYFARLDYTEMASRATLPIPSTRRRREGHHARCRP
jgi:DNA-directed RNA polymerase specialized sigma24 family protein